MITTRLPTIWPTCMQRSRRRPRRDAVGFSMGGGEVARYMSRHGGKGVIGAGLISSVVPYMLKTDDNPHGVPQATFDDMTAGMTKDRPAFMRDFLQELLRRRLYHQPGQRGDAQLGLAAVRCRPRARRRSPARSPSRRPISAPISPAFRVPTLVVHGTSDQTVPIDAAGRAAAKGIADAQLVEYDGAPHGLFATESDRLTKDLLTFWGGNTAYSRHPRENGVLSHAVTLATASEVGRAARCGDAGRMCGDDGRRMCGVTEDAT